MADIAKKRLTALLTDELPVFRARLGLSQEELAARVGISRQTLSLIETKKQTMTWVTFLALLALFENNKDSLSLLSAIGMFDGEDFSSCLIIKK